MARATPMLTAFNAGEWRGTLDGRIDHERYHVAARRMENFIPLVEGPAELRSGTRFVAVQADDGVGSTLIPFRFNTEQAYALEFSENKLRVFKDHGIVELFPGTPYQVATPYTAAQAKAIQFRQSGDVMFLAHPDVPPHKLERFDHDDWRLVRYVPVWEPFRAENIDETITAYASAETGVGITVTASSPIFTPDHVGGFFAFREIPESKNSPWIPNANPGNVDTGTPTAAGSGTVHYEGNVFRNITNPGGVTGTRPPIHDTGTESDGKWTWLYVHSGTGYVVITAYVSDTVVTADVVKELPLSVIGVALATFRWAFGAWDAVHGYPRALALWEDRLWWGGTSGDPDRVLATRVGGKFDSFKESRTAEGALAFRLNSDEPNVIETIVATKVLQLMTAGGIFPSAGADPAQAVSIENTLSLARQLNYGARPGVQAIAVDSVAVMVQRSGRAIREVLFNFDESNFQAPDLAKVASHLTAPGVRRIAYQQEPYRTLWCVMDNGELAAATYDRPQEVLGWWRVVLGGDNVVVDSVCVIPHPEEDIDELWLAVSRTVAGTTTRSIAYMERPFTERSQLVDAFYVDSGLTYDGAPATIISGLDHLEGQTVRILADGARVADQDVTGNQVVLDSPASKVHVGLGFDGVLIPMRIEGGGDDGVSQGKIKRIHRIILRLLRTAEGLLFGAVDDLAKLDDLVLRSAFDTMDAPADLASDDTVALPWPGEYEQGGYVVLRHASPTPCTIVALIPELITGER